MRGNGAFRALWSARTVSFLGDSLSLVALMLHVAATTGEALAVALLLLVGDFAPALLSPLTGTISDRFDLKRVMIACELAQGALVAVIAFALPSLPLLLVLVGLRAVAGQIFQPASRAAMPALVEDKDLERANARLGFGTNGAEAVGPLVAGLLFPLLGIRGVLLVDAVTFAISAALLAFLPRMEAGETQETFLGDAKAGLRYLAKAPAIRAIVVGFCAVVAFNGVDDVALVFLAKDLGGGQTAAGLLLAGVGIGLLAGYALLSKVSPKLQMVVWLIMGLAVSSVGNLLSGLAWAVGAAFVLQTVRGFGIAAMDVGANTLIQRKVPAALLGRVFGNFHGAIGAAAAFSYLAGGLLLDLTDASATLIIAGAGGLVATALTAWVLTRHSSDVLSQ
ncbi:Predicted arabinose efflux permease, MFS family [Amycolatopsis xylanica]|uniref:Predicted arabinose efflux permease, MFS family n=1 Tax=Amycolatopsis xylanica TaxID=589385 RepID=A0A1H3NP76_9PSEU|nr:MFS transporter [Amycolatopsis xylanica]SDY90757.1 Predicted arabinose efflux permease, MFS family [Amycolatopsis xylanica]